MGGTIPCLGCELCKHRRGLDTRKHACVNPLLSALDYGHSVTSFSLAPLQRWMVTWNCKPNKPFSHKAAFVGII